MAEAGSGSVKSDWKKRESFRSALAQVAIVAVILAGAVYFIRARGTKRQLVANQLKEARAEAIKGNPKDLQRALAELDDLFRVDSSAADGLALAADIHTQLWQVHKLPGAEAKARELLQRAEQAGSRTDERYGNRALHLVLEGKYPQADQLVEELRKKGANSARLWLAQARSHQEVGNLSLAKTAFGQAMDRAWKDPRFATAYGEALLDEGQLLQARDMLSKATAVNAEHLQARLDIALVGLYRKDRVKDAADTLKEVLERQEELTPGLKARALTVKAEMASFDGRYEEAIKAAEEALSINPEEHLARFAKARALALGRQPAAVQAFQEAVAKRRVAPFPYLDGAGLLQAQGQQQAALALLDRYQDTFKGVTNLTADGKTVAALDRDDRYWLARGDVLKEGGKLEEAMAAYDKAIAAESVGLVKAHYAKATIFLAKKEYEKAAQALVEITPPDGSGSLPEAYLAMGEALFAKKDFAPGCQNYAFALAKLKLMQAPRERLNHILEDVNKRLIAGGQKPMAKLWLQEARPIIQ